MHVPGSQHCSGVRTRLRQSQEGEYGLSGTPEPDSGEARPRATAICEYCYLYQSPHPFKLSTEDLPEGNNQDDHISKGSDFLLAKVKTTK